MRNRITPAHTTRARKTISASNTVERHTAALDAFAVACLEYATEWAKARSGVKPQCAVILRQALACYVESLDTIKTADAEALEVRALKAAGKGAGSGPWLEEVRQRIATLGTQGFMPIRYSAEELRQQAAMRAALENLL